MRKTFAPAATTSENGVPGGSGISGTTIAVGATGGGAMPEQRPDKASPDPLAKPHEKEPASDLLPHVYAELRRRAAVLSGRLQPGQTLQPTALVHEAYLRLVRDKDPGWEGRRHFFGAAARAMREI